MVKVIENIFEPELYITLKNLFFSNELSWYYNTFTVTYFDGDGNDTDVPKDDNFMFTHKFLEYQDDIPVISPYYVKYINLTLLPIRNALGFSEHLEILRIKANMYTNQGKVISMAPHTDFPAITTPYDTLIFHVNENNGCTVIGDTIIPSKANQLIAFDGTCEHYGTTQTDEKVRIVVNYNIKK